MIRFVEHKNIDSEKWDSAILNSQFPTLFASFKYLNLLVAPDIWNAVIVDDYEVVLPIPTRKKFSVSYVYPPFFVPQLGIFTKSDVSAELFKSMIDVIPSEYFLEELILNCSNKVNYDEKSFYRIPSFQLNLNKDYSLLYDDFSTNTKRNIKKNEKHLFSLKIETGSSKKIIDLFIDNRGREKSVNFSKKDYERLEEIASNLENDKISETHCVYDENGNLVAGAIFVFDYSRIWFWFSGRNNDAKGYPMYYLLNEFIKENSDSDKILDFNGSKNPNVARLYKGFGGQEYQFCGFRNYQNSFVEAVINVYKKFKSL